MHNTSDVDRLLCREVLDELLAVGIHFSGVSLLTGRQKGTCTIHVHHCFAMHERAAEEEVDKTLRHGFIRKLVVESEVEFLIFPRLKAEAERETGIRPVHVGHFVLAVCKRGACARGVRGREESAVGGSGGQLLPIPGIGLADQRQDFIQGHVESFRWQVASTVMVRLARRAEIASYVTRDTKRGHMQTFEIGDAGLPATSPASSPFDKIRQVRADGAEYWSARALMPIMGYGAWREFKVPIDRAMKAAANQGSDVVRDFGVSPKKSTGGRPAEDFELSRFAAYLVAMNGDPNKPEVAAAQAYFAIRTREAELAPMFDPASLSRMDILKIAMAAEEEKAVMAAVLESAAPAIAYHERHIAEDDAEGRTWTVTLPTSVGFPDPVAPSWRDVELTPVAGPGNKVDLVSRPHP